MDRSFSKTERSNRKWQWLPVSYGTPKCVAARIKEEVALLYPKEREESRRSSPRRR